MTLDLAKGLGALFLSLGVMLYCSHNPMQQYTNTGSFVLHSEANNWSWVPVVGCLTGGVLGAFAYIALIEIHHTPDDDGVTGYELQGIVTNTPELRKMQGNGLGMGNKSFTEDGMGPNNNQGPGVSVTEKTSQL